MTSLRVLLLATLGALLALTCTVGAEDYPARPVRLIVPFPPGGINDIVARIVAAHLGERLGKQVIVDNRSGAGGIVGAEIAAHAPKDGYTLLIVSIANALNPWLYKLPYDPVKAFAPVAFVVSSPTLVAVNPLLPIHSIKELIAAAKAKPGDLQYASSGIGTALHLAGELFKLDTGIDMLHVPFRGAGPALIDVMGGHTQVAFASVTSVMPHARTGKLRVLAIATQKRSASVPDIPTVVEVGGPAYEASNWIGVVAPAGTPEPIVARLHSEIQAILDSPDARKQFDAEGAEIEHMSAAEFGAFMEGEITKWGRVIKAAGIKAQ